MQRVDALAGFLNVSGNGVGDELVHDILQVGGGNLAADDVNHLLPDVPHLASLCVSCLLCGHLLLPCESNAEKPESVTISGLTHSVEVGQAVLALNFFADKLELPERPLGIVLILQISKRNLVHTSLQPIRGNPGALSPVHQGLANLAHFEEGGGLDIIPVLPGEGVHNLLLGSLLPANLQPLVFTDGHTSLVEVNQAIKAWFPSSHQSSAPWLP